MSGKRSIGIVFLVFLLTRVVFLGSFPIFNDEALYLEYTQLMHENWGQYKFISMDNSFGDWKPPLQYWMASLFVGLSDDPLLSARAVSLLVSLAGFWGLYLLVRRLFDRRTALIAAALFTLCPPVLMYNGQFVAETYVFSFGMLFLWFVLEATGSPPWSGRSWRYAVAAAVAAAALLLSKQSGAIYLGIAPVLVLAGTYGKERVPLRTIALRLLSVAAICAAGYGLYRLAIPPEIFAKGSQFTGRWSFTLKDLIELPTAAWRANAALVAAFYRSYYTLLAVPLALWAAGRAARDAVKHRDVRSAAMLAAFLASSAAVLFLLRWFNEYIYHTAAGAFLVVLLALALRDIVEAIRTWNASPAATRALVAAGGAVAAAMLASWIYQDALMIVSPGDYVRRSSAWMRGNYLSSWATGFGVPEAVKFLEEQKGPGIALVDPQWGNPGTSMAVYQSRYPAIKVLPLPAINEPAVQEALPQLASRFVIFSDFPGAQRDIWIAQVKEKLCPHSTVIAPERDQAPIMVCQF